MAQMSLVSAGSELLEERTVSTFLFKIPNFYNLYEAAKSSEDENAKKFAKKDFTVRAKSTGIPTNWQFYLKPNGDSFVSFYLKFLGPGSYSAEYEVQMTNRGSRILVAIIVPKNRFTTDSKIQDAALEIGCNLESAVELLEKFCNGQPQELELLVKFTVYYPSAQFKEVLSTDFNNALDSAVGSDVAFIFTEEGSGKITEKILAHKLILSIRNPVFAAMFASGMVEATKGEVEIGDVTPKAMKILLKLIYAGELDSAWVDVPDELLYGSEKYQLVLLKKFLSENIAPALTLWNVAKIRTLGGLYNLPKVVEAATKFMKDNFEQILQIYDLVLKNPN